MLTNDQLLMSPSSCEVRKNYMNLYILSDNNLAQLNSRNP
jgi:hypothetical protein